MTWPPVRRPSRRSPTSEACTHPRRAQLARPASPRRVGRRRLHDVLVSRRGGHRPRAHRRARGPRRSGTCGRTSRLAWPPPAPSPRKAPTRSAAERWGGRTSCRPRRGGWAGPDLADAALAGATVVVQRARRTGRYSLLPRLPVGSTAPAFSKARRGSAIRCCAWPAPTVVRRAAPGVSPINQQ